MKLTDKRSPDATPSVHPAHAEHLRNQRAIAKENQRIADEHAKHMAEHPKPDDSLNPKYYAKREEAWLMRKLAKSSTAGPASPAPTAGDSATAKGQKKNPR